MELFADGGVISKNPSEFGGTWAFVLVENDKVIYQKSGIYEPERLEVDKVTNNHMELIALLKGLSYCAVNKIQVDCVYSDSNVSLGRLFRGWAMENIPNWLIIKRRDIMGHYNINTMRWQLLDGHPTRLQLQAGIGKRGHPVSKYNVLCDALCQVEAQRYLESLIPV